MRLAVIAIAWSLKRSDHMKANKTIFHPKKVLPIKINIYILFF